MIGTNRKPRRRNLPILGMTSLGLAVSAGSLGLYRAAVAEPLPLVALVQADDQPQWAKPTAAAAPNDGVVQAALQVPALPSLPPGTWPALPATGPTPALSQLPLPQLPVLPMMPEPMLLAAAPAPVVVPPLNLPAAPIDVPAIRIPGEVIETAPMPRPHARPASALAVPQPAQPEKMLLPAMPIQPAEPKISLPASPDSLSVIPTRPSPGVPALPVSNPGRPLVPTVNDTAGEPPMIPSFTTVKSAVLGLALGAAPLAPVQASPVPDRIPQADEPKKVEAPEIKKDPLDELKKSLEAIRKEVEAERKERITIADEVLGKKTADGKTELGLTQKVEALDVRLKKIEDLLIKLDGRFTEMANAKSVKAEKPTVPGKDGAKEMPKEKPIVGAKAVLRLINEYPVSISMMINNDQSYRLEPGQVRLVDIKAGEFTYELLHSGAEPVKMTVKENETMTLKIR